MRVRGELGFDFSLLVASGEFLSKYFLFLEGNLRAFALGDRHFLQTIVH